MDTPAARHFYLKNLLHSVLLITGLLFLSALIGWIIAGTIGILWSISVGLILFVLMLSASDKLVLRLYKARPISHPQLAPLHSILDWLVKRAELADSPALYYIPSNALIAFSVGLKHDRAIAISAGMLQTMNARELAAILAHEISHIKNHDLWVMLIADIISRITSVMSLTGYLLLIVYIPYFMTQQQAVPWLLFALLILTPNLSALIQLALSRTREFSADQLAVEMTGDPAGLISALSKLEYYEKHWLQKLLLPGMREPNPSLLRTHPPTAQRLRRLQLIARQAHNPFAEDKLSLNQLRPPGRTRHRMSGLWH